MASIRLEKFAYVHHSEPGTKLVSGDEIEAKLLADDIVRLVLGCNGSELLLGHQVFATQPFQLRNR